MSRVTLVDLLLSREPVRPGNCRHSPCALLPSPSGRWLPQLHTALGVCYHLPILLGIPRVKNNSSSSRSASSSSCNNNSSRVQVLSSMLSMLSCSSTPRSCRRTTSFWRATSRRCRSSCDSGDRTLGGRSTNLAGQSAKMAPSPLRDVLAGIHPPWYKRMQFLHCIVASEQPQWAHMTGEVLILSVLGLSF